MLNQTLKVIRDDLTEVNNIPSYDELFEAFTKLHIDLKKIVMKNVSLKKKNVELSNKNESLNTKVICLELENKKMMRLCLSKKALHLSTRIYLLMI